jgi:hypothetical protein
MKYRYYIVTKDDREYFLEGELSLEDFLRNITSENSIFIRDEKRAIRCDIIEFVTAICLEDNHDE